VSHIADLWERTFDGRRIRTERYGKGRRWLARYDDPDGRARSKTFARKLDAERFLATVETDKLCGTYLDPDAAGAVRTGGSRRGRVRVAAGGGLRTCT
jgi:hypothetical protein